MSKIPRESSIKRLKDDVHSEDNVISIIDIFPRDILLIIICFLNPFSRNDFLKTCKTIRFIKPKKLEKVDFIHGWIKHVLIGEDFAKSYSGLYLWSHQHSMGKTLLCRVISKIINTYWWTFEDENYQQLWKIDSHYKCIIYDGLNDCLLPFRHIEDHGDGKAIAIRKRKQVNHYTKEKTPFIITSNKSVDNLGYDRNQCDMNVWKENMIVICLDDLNILSFIDVLKKEYNINMDEKMDKEIDMMIWMQRMVIINLDDNDLFPLIERIKDQYHL